MHGGEAEKSCSHWGWQLSKTGEHESKQHLKIREELGFKKLRESFHIFNEILKTVPQMKYLYLFF